MAEKTRKRKRAVVRDPHYLYSAAVQSVDADLDFFRRVYKKERGKPFRRFREDFCGTALLAHAWVKRHRDNEAWGVDLDQPTLDWGRRHYGPVLNSAEGRLHLIRGNVLDAASPPVDVVAVLNFSYSVFHERETLLRYFRHVRRTLDREGLFFIDAWGGSGVMVEDQESRRIPAEVAFDGTRIPAFTYIWEQARFNPVDHHIVCHISFKLGDGRRLRRAFSYDWRLWTLPELRELMLEAGFESTAVYVEGWDDDADDADGVFRRKTYFENQDGWVAYVVGRR